MAIAQNNSLKLNLSLDFRLISLLLLAAIAAMLFIWKPWTASTNNDRTVQVTGEATLKAEPDEFVFYPTYEFKNTDKDTALAAATAKSDEVVTKLKELGVADNKIKTNTAGYEGGVYFYSYNPADKKTTYNLMVQVTVNSRDMAQKIQDYLVTTAPTGAVSPSANFSEDKRKTLESEARDKATKDARTKAEQSAKNLGFKLGKVKTVTDGNGFGDIVPLHGVAEDSAAVPSKPQLSVQPGESDLHYSVTVTYFLR